jgi:hypothetical protein
LGANLGDVGVSIDAPFIIAGYSDCGIKLTNKLLQYVIVLEDLELICLVFLQIGRIQFISAIFSFMFSLGENLIDGVAESN